MRRAFYAGLSQLSYTTTISAPPKPPPMMTFMMGAGFVCADCRRHFFGGKPMRQEKHTGGAEGKKRKATERNEPLRVKTARQPPQMEKEQLTQKRQPGKSSLEPPGKRLAPDWKTSGRERAVYAAGWTNYPHSIDELELGTRRLARYIEVSPELVRGNKDSPMFARLLAESDFTSPGGAPKIVDRRVWGLRRKDWTNWKSLLMFRQRVFGISGVKEVWKGIKERDLELHASEEGSDLDSIWRILVSAALKDDRMADELLEYAHDHSERLNHYRQWAPLYDTIMLHQLVNSSEQDTVLSWHWRLFPVFTSQSWAALIAAAVDRQPSPRCHHNLRMIHATLHERGLYTSVINDLCNKSMYQEAVRWSKHFAAHGDLPKDSSASDQLVAWLSRNGTYREIQDLFQHLNKMGIPLVESTAVAAVKSRRATKEVADLIFGPSGFPPKVLKDEFWYTLFQTSLTPKEVFVYALHAGSGCVVGIKTLQKASELLQRNRRATIDILQMAGLHIDLTAPPSSSLSGEVELGIIDAIHNEKLQILLLRGRVHPAVDHIAFLCKNNITLTHESLLLLSRTFLRPRRRGKLPMQTAHVFRHFGSDVDMVISLFLALQRSGTSILWHLWSEVIRRLGMTSKLGKLERLLLILAQLYLNPTLPVRSKENPLRKLFVPTMLRSLVEWGLLGHTDPTWGVRLIKKLQAIGVHVDVRSVRRAVRVRLGRGGAAGTRGDVAKAGALLEEAWGAPVWEGGARELRDTVARERRVWGAFRRHKAWVNRQMQARIQARRLAFDRPAAERQPAEGTIRRTHYEPTVKLGRRVRRLVSHNQTVDYLFGPDIHPDDVK